MTSELTNKIEHFNLDLDYSNPLFNSLETQTNQIINSILNLYLIQFKDKKKIILEYQDDLLSVITYRILKNICAINEFEIFIYGKKKKTKTYIEKKDKNISLRKINKIIKKEKQDILYVSCFNPIYKVINSKKVFNVFQCDTYNPIANFTPDEIHMTQVFYHIGYIKDEINFTSSIIKDYSFFCDSIYNMSSDIDIFLSNFLYPIPNEINLIWLCGDEKIDEEELKEIQNTKGMNFYFYQEEPSIFKSYFSLYLSNKSNIPNKNFGNINNYQLVNEFIKFLEKRKKEKNINYTINWIGKWDNIIKNKILMED